MGFRQWFTNYTFIVGEPTLPEEMLDKWVTPRQSKNKPWTAPGTAPITGNGCGVNGGNQYGCGLGLFTFRNVFFSNNTNTMLQNLSNCEVKVHTE